MIRVRVWELRVMGAGQIDVYARTEPSSQNAGGFR